MAESLKQIIETNQFRGCYETRFETPLTSPLDFILWLAFQQYQRNLRSNHQQVMEAATGEN